MATQQDAARRGRWIPWAIGLGIIALALVTLVVSVGQHDRALAEQLLEVSELSDELAAIDADRVDLAEDVLSEGIGADMGRVEQDREVINEMLGQALTWGSHDEYLEAREAMRVQWGMALDSQFMTTYLPEAPGKVDSEGTLHSYIDAMGLNSEFAGADAQVVAARGDAYDYLVEASSTTTSEDSSTTLRSRSALLMTVRADGTVSDVRGFAVQSPTRTA